VPKAVGQKQQQQQQQQQQQLEDLFPLESPPIKSARRKVQVVASWRHHHSNT
jgi:hypothetical protein